MCRRQPRHRPGGISFSPADATIAIPPDGHKRVGRYRRPGGLPAAASGSGDLGGVTYPANLRLLVQHIHERQWVAMFKDKTPLPGYPMRPPMPWLDYHRLNVRDLQALYVFIQRLGPAGQPAPRYVPPGRTPKTSYIVFVPQRPGSRPHP